MNSFAQRILASVEEAATDRQLDTATSALTQVLGKWDKQKQGKGNGAGSITWLKGAKEFGLKQIVLEYTPDQEPPLTLHVTSKDGKTQSFGGTSWVFIRKQLKAVTKVPGLGGFAKALLKIRPRSRN